MATTYKTLLDDDISTTRTLLHEYIPITGSILSSSVYSGQNIHSYSHGMFQTVYDYPWTSSSANQLVDMTVGFSSDSPASASSDTYAQKKINIYNQMAQILVGFDSTGSVLKFDRDGEQTSGNGDDKINSCFFLNFSRLLVKDEIRKGQFKMTVGIGDYSSPFQHTMSISDSIDADKQKINSPTGEYGLLYASDLSGYDAGNTSNPIGLLFYQAGVAVISPCIFAVSGTNPPSASLSSSNQGLLDTEIGFYNTENIEDAFKNNSIDVLNGVFRKRIKDLSFQNTTELNSTIYFCRANHNEFNYSSNPTYVSSSVIRVKQNSIDNPVSYITTVGLYSSDNELLAVAKLSQPLKKTNSDELTLRVRLDF